MMTSWRTRTRCGIQPDNLYILIDIEYLGRALLLEDAGGVQSSYIKPCCLWLVAVVVMMLLLVVLGSCTGVRVQALQFCAG